MQAYDKSYLNEIVETQGKLFSFVAEMSGEYDTDDFIIVFTILI